MTETTQEELQQAIEHDQQHGKWYAYGRAVLGGTDFIHPVEIANNGNVVCRTGSSQKPVAPDEYLRVHREFSPFRKVGIWDFTPYDDPAANDVRQAHTSPNSAGRRLHDLRSECEQLRDRLARYERDLHDEPGKDRSQDVDWLRAGFLQRGAEIERLEDRLARFERRALLRSEIDAPDRAVAWTRSATGECLWVLQRGTSEPAPDLWPGEGPVTLVVLDDQ